MSVKVRFLYTTVDGTDVWGLKIDSHGHRQTISIGSKAAANRAKYKAELAVASGKLGLLNKKEKTVTFGEVARDWLDVVEASLAPATHARYKNIVDLHLTNKFLASNITDINKGDVRNEILGYSKSGASKSSISIMGAVVSSILGHAIDDEIITESPCNGVMKRLKIAPGERKVNPFSTGDLELLFANAAQEYRDFLTTLYHTGARVGEMIVLEWSDVDFQKRKLRINKTNSNGEVRETTKTYRERSIDISDDLLTILTERKKRDKKVCSKLEIDQKYVFHKRGKRYIHQTIWNVVKRTCRKLALGNHTIHDIRHTTASVLLARGVPITYVSNLLGHSKVSMTFNMYSHYMPSETEGAINALSSKPI